MSAWSRAVLAGAVLCCTPACAEGLFGGGNKLDPSFCKEHNLRQTVIYVDDEVLVTGQNGWLQTLYDKLTATLAPGERTTLVELSPMTGRSTERWSGCWPGYTAEELAKLTGGFRLFSSDPVAALKQQQAFFGRDLGLAVVEIGKTHARPESQVSIDPANPPTRSIVRALASDGARYAHSQETIRAVIYSNLAENSDLGSVFTPGPAPADLGNKLGTFLRRSVFYAFGAGAYIKSSGALQDSIRSFWTGSLQSMAANVNGLGADLSIPNVVPTRQANFDVSLKHSDALLTGRLSLLVGADGALVDSWLGIVRLRTSALNGTYVCRPANAAEPTCSLQATTTTGLVTMSPSETVTMATHGSPAMTGTIGVPGSNVNLAINAAPAEN